jgi:hypothetical protein
MDGYNVKMNSRNGVKTESILNNLSDKTINVYSEYIPNANQNFDENASNILASAESIIQAPPKKKLANKNNSFSNKNNRLIKPSSAAKLSTKESSDPKSSSLYNSNDDGNYLLRVFGWLGLSLGFLIFLFLSILVGVILMIFGFVFIIVGRKKNKSSKTKLSDDKIEDRPEYIDVVYLKNGGIVRGIIIEQIPNIQLKVQTKDENVFVFKIEEIERITKELSK